MTDTINLRKTIYKIITNGIISVFIAAPVVALMILYNYKIWIFSEIPVYLISCIIVFIFLFLSVKLYPAVNIVLEYRQFAFEGLVKSLIKDTEDKRNIRDIIKSAADILYKSLSVKNLFVLLLNNETGLFEKFYTLGSEPDLKSGTDIRHFDTNSPLIRWFAQNKDVLNSSRINSDDKAFSAIKEDIDNFIFRLNIKVILPVYNNGQIIGIICLGEKNTMALYKSGAITKLQRFNRELNRRVSGAIDYEEWNQGQFASGILDLSSEILSKAVPLHLPKLPEISFGAFYIPRYREGIDYFDIITPTNIGAGVIVTDISGRGINNAIYSVILRSAFHSCIEEAHSTFATIQKLNKALHDYTKGTGGIVKAYYFYYNIYTMRLTYTNAGYQPLEIYRVDKNIYESLDTDGYPLGTDLTADYGMGRTNLLVGDIGFLYSRALIESKNQKGEKYGLTQLQGIIKENRRRHPSEITAILKEDFQLFMGTSSPGANILVVIFKV